jgi:hypothetical protein
MSLLIMVLQFTHCYFVNNNLLVYISEDFM